MFTYGDKLYFYMDKFDYLPPIYEGRVTKFELSPDSDPLPNGLSLEPNDGSIYGVPILPMTVTVTVRAYNDIYYTEEEVDIRAIRKKRNKNRIDM